MGGCTFPCNHGLNGDMRKSRGRLCDLLAQSHSQSTERMIDYAIRLTDLDCVSHRLTSSVFWHEARARRLWTTPATTPLATTTRQWERPNRAGTDGKRRLATSRISRVGWKNDAGPPTIAARPALLRVC